MSVCVGGIVVSRLRTQGAETQENEACKLMEGQLTAEALGEEGAARPI